MPETLARRRLPIWLAGLPLAIAPWPPPAPAQAAAPLICPAPQSSSPCGAGPSRGPAAGPVPDSGAANPVHLATGEKFLRETDLPEPFAGGHPSFIRLYRSGSAENGPLGRGWTSEYDIRLRPAAPDGWHLDLPDGRRVRFDARGLGADPPMAASWRRARKVARTQGTQPRPGGAPMAAGWFSTHGAGCGRSPPRGGRTSSSTATPADRWTAWSGKSGAAPPSCGWPTTHRGPDPACARCTRRWVSCATNTRPPSTTRPWTPPKPARAAARCG